MVYARALSATALLGLVCLLGFYGAPAGLAPRRLHPSDVVEYTHALPECMDVWSNEWCQARKAEGQCHDVLLKCMGTCGGCCLDDAGKEACDAMLEDEVCHVQATGAYGANHLTDCLETCGACQRELPVACSFEESEEHDGINHDDAACLLDRWTPAENGLKFSLESFGPKKWTGPRYAADRERFAILDTEARAPGSEAWLTTAWGRVAHNQVVTFEYSMFTRDFPDAMGTLEVAALVSHENKGYRPIWTESAAHTAMEWHTALVEVGEETAGVHDHGAEGAETQMPVRLRFRAITGASELSDIAIDNIQLLTRVCGDGKRTYEQCDDGNTADGDGCSAHCEVEPGYACFLEHPHPSEFHPEYPGDVCLMLFCGDGLITGDETCDDGNPMDADGCSAACQVEAAHWCDHDPAAPLDHTKPELGQYLSFPGPSACAPVYEDKPRLVGRTLTWPNKDVMQPPLVSSWDAPFAEGLWELSGWTADDPATAADETAAYASGETLYAAGLLEIYSTAMSLTDGGEYKAACPNDDTNEKLINAACREFGFSAGRACHDDSDEDACALWGAADPADGAHEDDSMCSGHGRIFTTCKGKLPDADGATCEIGGAMLDGKYFSKAHMDYIQFACPVACRTCKPTGVDAELHTTRRGTWDHINTCDADATSIGGGCARAAAAVDQCGEGLYIQCYHPNLCGDGKRSPHELPLANGAVACDDGNALDGDGCSSSCTVEQGWHCSGGSWRSINHNSADSCVQVECGDSKRVATEGCDDGNAIDNDGCSATCGVEEGYVCVGENDEVDGDLNGLSKCYAIGSLKLLDQPTGPHAAGEAIVGSSPLLVMASSGWGSVCFSDFGINEATVACTDLANTWLQGRSWYVQSPGFKVAEAADFGARVLATRLQVACAGTETKLADCGTFTGVTHTRPVKCHDQKVHLTCSTDP